MELARAIVNGAFSSVSGAVVVEFLAMVTNLMFLSEILKKKIVRFVHY